MARDVAYDRRAFCKIFIAGFDATDVLEPFLISVTVTSTEGGGGDKCEIELDDRDGRVPIPGPDDGVEVQLGWASSGPDIIAFQTGSLSQLGVSGDQFDSDELPWSGGMYRVFTGSVSNVESGFSRRGGGRRLWVDARAGSMLNEEKQLKSQTFGEGEKDYDLDSQESNDGSSGGGQGMGGGGSFSGGPSGSGGGDGEGVPFSEVMNKLFKGGVSIDSSIGDIKRKFWHVANESPRQFASRMSRELGGVFGFKDGQPTVSAGAGRAASGATMAVVEAIWGQNLISWRIHPFATRPDYKGTRQHFYLPKLGKWDKTEGDISQGGPFLGVAKALLTLPNPAPNKQVGGQWNSGLGEGVENDRGKGWCVINGEPQAQGGGILHIEGARQGVDGNYRIDEAEHKYTRGGGYTTRCKLDRPDSEARVATAEMMWPSPDAPGPAVPVVPVTPAPLPPIPEPAPDLTK